MATNLAPQPLEIADFSGGMTENVLQENMTRYRYADNFFITVDKMLEERSGFQPFGLENEALAHNWFPGGFRRVDSLFSFMNETLLLAHQARTVYIINPEPLSGEVWTTLKGPSGNEALSNGEIYSQMTMGEFNRAMYITSDAPGGTIPTKVYRDEINTWKVVTAGLPRVYANPNYTTQTLLATCISLANAIRTAMMSHMKDAVYKDYSPGTRSVWIFGALHPGYDKYALSYFETVPTWVDWLDYGYPGPGVAPITGATDEQSLYNLIFALYGAYTRHVVSTTSVTNHWEFRYFTTLGRKVFPYGPQAPLAYNTKPADLATAAAQLDDLVQKWNWHRGAIWTHEATNDTSIMSRWPINGQKIGNVFLTKPVPYITPDYTDLFRFVNNLKATYNQHVIGIATTGTGLAAHVQGTIKDINSNSNNWSYPADFTCKQADCTSIDDMYLMIWTLRVAYQNLHYADAYNYGIAKNQITMNTTLNSANVTNVIDVATSTAKTLTVGSYVFSFANPFNTTSGEDIGTGQWAKVLSSGSGTATLSRTLTGTVTGMAAQWTPAMYHFYSLYATNPTASVAAPTSAALSDYDAVTFKGGYSFGSDIKTWLGYAQEFYTALYAHANDQNIHYPSSLAGVVYPYTPFFIPAVSTVGYAFTYSHQYTVEPNGLVYLVQSNPTLTSTSQYIGVSYAGLQTIPSLFPKLYPNAAALTTRANILSGLPVLANDKSTNYDTPQVKLNIYRTTDGGNTYYLLAQVPNGTTTYSDQTPDAKLITAVAPTDAIISPLLYTAGGVVGFDQPPVCKVLHIVNNTAYYGGITDTGQFLPNRVRQSIQGNPDASPATFTDDLDDTIVGITSTRNNVIVGCVNSIYRLSGSFNQLGQGAITHERISDTLGMLNAHSIVKTEVGVFFAGNDGFYYTDGFQLIKISLELDKTYAAFTKTDEQKRRIHGSYDKITRRVFWSVSDNLTEAENTKIFVFYLDYGIKPSGVFTTLSNTTSFKPTSTVFIKGKMYLGDGSGFVLVSNPNLKSDVVPDKNNSVFGPTRPLASTWDYCVIPYNYSSCALDNGTTFQRKWTTKIHLVGENHGNVALQPTSIRDLNQTQKGYSDIAPVNYNVNVRWGNCMLNWGSTLPWLYDGKFDLWRRIPGGQLRSDFRQFRFTPGKVVVYASGSGEFPEGALATTIQFQGSSSVTLLTPAGRPTLYWPQDCVGYSIAFEYDGYTNEWVIGFPYSYASVRLINAVVFSVVDPGNTLPTNAIGMKWVIRGQKKEQRVVLSSYVIHYGFLGDKNENYPGKYNAGGAGAFGENPK